MTIRTKLIITNVVVFGIILFAVAAVIYDRTRETEFAKLDSQLEVYAAGFVTEFEDQWENNEFPENGELEALASPPLTEIRVQLVDSTGKVLFGRGELPPPPTDLLNLNFQNQSTHRNIKIGVQRFRWSIRPVESDDKINFALVLAAPIREIEERLANLTLILIATLSGALLLSAIAIYFITGRAFRPITRMVEAAEMISAATLHHRLKVPQTQDEVRRLAEALNEMMARIEAAFRSQRQFVADASHELRTPLTVVYSELEYLRREIEGDNLNDSFTTVLLEIDRLSHLVQQLLLLARVDAQKLTVDRQAVRLDETLAECIRTLQSAAAEHRVRIQLQVTDVVEIEGDAGHLQRALLNVIDNAVKYSPEEGEVKVEVRRDRDTAILTVEDQGPGISEANRELVFKRFYRSPAARQTHDGSGLGLAIAKELIEAHGGRIDLGTAKLGGALVRVELPLHQPKSQSDNDLLQT